MASRYKRGDRVIIVDGTKSYEAFSDSSDKRKMEYAKTLTPLEYLSDFVASEGRITHEVRFPPCKESANGKVVLVFPEELRLYKKQLIIIGGADGTDS